MYYQRGENHISFRRFCGELLVAFKIFAVQVPVSIVLSSTFNALLCTCAAALCHKSRGIPVQNIKFEFSDLNMMYPLPCYRLYFYMNQVVPQQNSSQYNWAPIHFVSTLSQWQTLLTLPKEERIAKPGVVATSIANFFAVRIFLKTDLDRICPNFFSLSSYLIKWNFVSIIAMTRQN